VKAVGYQTEELRWQCGSFGVFLVEVFSELAPEGVEHEFGHGFPAGIFLDDGSVEGDAFSFFVLAHVE